MHLITPTFDRFLQMDDEFLLELDAATVKFDEHCAVTDVLLKEGAELHEVLADTNRLLFTIESFGMERGLQLAADSKGDLATIMGLDEIPVVTDENEDELVTAATEGLKEGVTAVWNAIVNFVKKLLAAIGKFLKWVFSGFGLFRKKIETASARLDDAAVKPWALKKVTIGVDEANQKLKDIQAMQASSVTKMDAVKKNIASLTKGKLPPKRTAKKGPVDKLVLMSLEDLGIKTKADLSRVLQEYKNQLKIAENMMRGVEHLGKAHEKEVAKEEAAIKKGEGNKENQDRLQREQQALSAEFKEAMSEVRRLTDAIARMIHATNGVILI